MLLTEWMTKWKMPYAAIADLRIVLGQMAEPSLSNTSLSEGGVQSRIRLAAAQSGWRLWRNNVGVLEDKNGRPVRYGLVNDSKKLNDEIKSGDLIGIKPILIGPQHIGHVIGQFVSREVKKSDWKYGEDLERENAQERWAMLVNSMGGDAKFTTGEL